MRGSIQLAPAARKADLIIEETGGETLVYDLRSHKAHCLNRTSALVWKHCDGKRSVAEVALRVEAELGTEVSDDVVWLALNQLEKSRLLEARVERADGSRVISRRELARRLGIATAIALPFIASIDAPAAIQAATPPPCGVAGDSCSNPGDPPCCPDFSCDGICFPN